MRMCPNCSNPVDDDASYCPQCGLELGVRDAPSPPKKAPPPRARR